MVVLLFMAVKETEPWENIQGSIQCVEGVITFNVKVDQTIQVNVAVRI